MIQYCLYIPAIHPYTATSTQVATLPYPKQQKHIYTCRVQSTVKFCVICLSACLCPSVSPSLCLLLCLSISLSLTLYLSLTHTHKQTHTHTRSTTHQFISTCSRTCYHVLTCVADRWQPTTCTDRPGTLQLGTDSRYMVAGVTLFPVQVSSVCI